MPYGMLTFTRKKRLAELAGAQLSVRFALPSTVYTRSCFVPPYNGRMSGCPVDPMVDDPMLAHCKGKSRCI